MLKPLLIAILVGIAGVYAYSYFSANVASNELRTETPATVQANNTKVLIGNVTITGEGELTEHGSGQIAGILKGPTLVNITK